MRVTKLFQANVFSAYQKRGSDMKPVFFNKLGFLMVFVFLGISTAPTQPAQAQPAHEALGCTEWTKTKGTNCLDRNKVHYTRSCNDAHPDLRCQWHRSPTGRNYPCLSEPNICMHKSHNPNDYVSLDLSPEGSCTSWRVVRGENCGSHTVKWERDCTVERVPKNACTHRSKGYPDEEDAYFN